MTKKSPGQAAREEWGILNHMDDRDPLLWDAIAAAAIEATRESTTVGCPGCGLTLEPHGPDCRVNPDTLSKENLTAVELVLGAGCSEDEMQRRVQSARRHTQNSKVFAAIGPDKPPTPPDASELEHCADQAQGYCMGHMTCDELTELLIRERAAVRESREGEIERLRARVRDLERVWAYYERLHDGHSEAVFNLADPPDYFIDLDKTDK